MGEWELIGSPPDWANYKASLEKIPHLSEPRSYPCLVRSRYNYAGSAWDHLFVYQSDAELLFGFDSTG